MCRRNRVQNIDAYKETMHMIKLKDILVGYLSGLYRWHNEKEFWIDKWTTAELCGDNYVLRIYGDNKQLITESVYNSEGQLDGTSKRYLHGKLFILTEYKNNQRHGFSQSWDQGEPYWIGYYENGRHIEQIDWGKGSIW